MAEEERREEFAIMERKDEQQIMAELEGRYMEEFVYRFEIGDKPIVGLSWAGVKELARVRGGVDVEDCKIEDKGDYWLASAKATDRLTLTSLWGVSTQPKMMKLKDGTEVEDKFAIQKSVSKAQRNAIRALMPEPLIKIFIDQKLQETERKTPKRIDIPYRMPPAVTTAQEALLMNVPNLSKLPWKKPNSGVPVDSWREPGYLGIEDQSVKPELAALFIELKDTIRASSSKMIEVDRMDIKIEGNEYQPELWVIRKPAA